MTLVLDSLLAPQGLVNFNTHDYTHGTGRTLVAAHPCVATHDAPTSKQRSHVDAINCVPPAIRSLSARGRVKYSPHPVMAFKCLAVKTGAEFSIQFRDLSLIG